MMKHLGRTRRRSAAGMTLIETACAAAIVALGVVGLCNVAATSAAMHTTRVQKQAALRAVEQEISTISATTFATISATFNNQGFDVLLDGKSRKALAAKPGDADGKPGHVTVTAPTGNGAELLEIAVRVDWTSPHGAQSVERRFRLARLGTGP